MIQNREEEANEDIHLHLSLLTGRLKRAKVLVVALDWDQTVLDIHTESKWKDGPEELASHVRPFFLEFIPAVIRKSIILSIVTNSAQRKLIQQTLSICFGPTVARQILVRCKDASWVPPIIDPALNGWTSSSRRGKQLLILNIVVKVYNDCGVVVNPENVLLIDDTDANVKLAILDGCNACNFDPCSISNLGTSTHSQIFNELSQLIDFPARKLSNSSRNKAMSDGKPTKARKRSRKERHTYKNDVEVPEMQRSSKAIDLEDHLTFDPYKHHSHQFHKRSSKGAKCCIM